MKTRPIAAITGGAGALGSELARTLVKKGYAVALYDTEHARGRLDELVKELGEAAFAHASDFSSDAAWGAALDATKKALGALPTYAALIAGAWAGGTPVHLTKDDGAYQKLVTTNIDTTYRALRALLPAMVDTKSGSVVVIGAKAVARPWTSAGAAAYAGTKAAVVAIAQSVAEEVLESGVRVNAVLPSTMDTAANRAAMPSADFSKWVTTSSAAGVIAFLLSDDARDVSGAAIPVYGRS